VLTEELEVANGSLQRANDELETRVDARTREIAATSADLGRSELRFRTLIEGMPQLVWRASDGGHWTWASPQWLVFTGQTMEQSQGMGWLDALHPDDREGARLAWSGADAVNGLAFEGRICETARKRYRHFQTRASVVRTPDGKVLEWLGTSTDVDDLLRLQQRQSVLVAELQHRTRNLMAVVQSVTYRTVKGSANLKEFRASIEDRLHALARVQGLLSDRAAGTRVAFDTLLRAELAGHFDLDAQGNATQISVSGPPGVPLQSSLVQTFALALHELLTNAIKYGALADPAGSLKVEWTVVDREGEQRLILDWRERGVTDMPNDGAAARGGGYGRELIERALPYQMGAKTSYAFLPDGVHCSIDVGIPADDTVMEKAVG
jgi:two-component system CheB/CheR fusion protein